ncbi:MAG TPA: hypothetical protein VFD27_00880 [Chthoniobacteraceae bacterium]|jgi:hypothetical protein|nr:hypothetical protein [Chthoniobacteraceae bacterium]
MRRASDDQSSADLRASFTRHDFREWSQPLDWIVQNIFDAAPLMDGHVEAQERVSNPTLTFVRRIAIEIERGERLGEPLSASQIYEVADEADVEIPGLKPESRGDEEAARKIIGKKLGALFRSSDTVAVDGFTVARK